MTAAVPHRGCPTTTGLSLCPPHREGEWKEINSGSNLMPWTESHSEFVPFGIFDKYFSCKEGERVKVGEEICRWAHMDVVRQIPSTTFHL